MSLKITPVNGRIGVSVYGDTHVKKDFSYKYGFLESGRTAAVEVYSQSRLTLELLGDLVRKLISPATPTERTEATKSLTGPIGIGDMFVKLAQADVSVTVISA